MSFISPEFLIFYVLAVTVYFAMPYRFRWVWLLAASYFFYMYWNAWYLFLIVGSTFIDYFAARWIDSTPATNTWRRRLLLATSVLTNLGVLFTFKYFNFFGDSVNLVLESFGLNYGVGTLDILLPVGISFYTFQSMSYTIDVYRGEIEAERNAGVFAAYVAFFPQLVAGPIERAGNMLDQFKKNHNFEYARAVDGLRLVLWGFFKKVVIADRVAVYVNEVFNSPEEYAGLTLLIAAVFFAIQIYCDFSGYSDIAIGTARVMGFNLMTNFRQPYLSHSIREFWRRWHISLSGWFRDYVYIPLGGSRVPFPRMLLNLGIVFLLSGLWHGAAWTFVIWGALHGLYIVLETTFARYVKLPPIPSSLRWLTTMLLVLLGWVFFRANNLGDALYIIQNMWNVSQGLDVYAPFALSILGAETEFIISWVAIGFLFLYDLCDSRGGIIQSFKQRPAIARWAAYYALMSVVCLSIVYGSTSTEFIYFQF